MSTQPERAMSSIRLSLGRFNNQPQIELAGAQFKECQSQLRALNHQ